MSEPVISDRGQYILERLRQRLELAQLGHGDKLLTMKLKVRNGVPHKVIWGLEDEEELTSSRVQTII